MKVLLVQRRDGTTVGTIVVEIFITDDQALGEWLHKLAIAPENCKMFSVQEAPSLVVIDSERYGKVGSLHDPRKELLR
jgi:hypothetical protein